MDKARGYIGLCARANRIAVGAHGVEAAIRGKTARLVVLDETAAENTKKKYTQMCRHYAVPMASMADPCGAAGKSGRVCIAILDSNLAKQIENSIQLEQIAGGKG
jgi:ribosomal protein L7Ae-like RNA K-turn-binding protein